jgi:hypothetical protein
MTKLGELQIVYSLGAKICPTRSHLTVESRYDAGKYECTLVKIKDVEWAKKWGFIPVGIVITYAVKVVGDETK